MLFWSGLLVIEIYYIFNELIKFTEDAEGIFSFLNNMGISTQI